MSEPLLFSDIEAIRARNEERKTDPDYTEMVVGITLATINGGPSSSEDIDALLADRDAIASLLDAVTQALSMETEALSCCRERALEIEKQRDRALTSESRLLALTRQLSSNPKSDDGRESGRTTRLILRGLIALSEGHDVYVVGSTYEHGRRLARQIAIRAKEMRIARDSDDGFERAIRFGGPDSEMTGFRGVTLLDHFAIERMETNVPPRVKHSEGEHE